jgi:precorrin-6Y C5,15-methyltransferase (decarboxylating)
LREAKRIIIGGCDKKTKLRIINELSKDMNCGDIVAIPLIDIQTIKDLRDTLKENNFEVNLNLIQTYKSLSISEGIRMDPNNPIFLLRGRKLF